MTPIINLYEEKDKVACKRKNMHNGVMFATHSHMLKSKSEKRWKLGDLKVDQVTSYETIIMYL